MLRLLCWLSLLLTLCQSPPPFTRPYDEDARLAAVHQRIVLTRSANQVARDNGFGSARTVQRLVERWRNYHSVLNDRVLFGRQQGRPLSYTPHDVHIILNALRRNPELQQHEIRQVLIDQGGPPLSIPTISRILNRAGWSRQRFAYVSYTVQDCLHLK